MIFWTSLLAENFTILALKLRKTLAQVSYLPRALRLVWAASRDWTICWAVLLLVQGLLPVGTLYLTRGLVNSLVAALREGGSWQGFRPGLALGAAIAGIMLLGEMLRGVAGWVRTAQAELVQDHITGLIHEKSAAADLAFYESADFYDHLHRARADATHRPVALLESLGGLTQNGITLAAMFAVLIPYGAWLPVALLASTLPALYVVLRYTLRQHQWRFRTTADERRTWYYDWLLTTGETAAELRLFGLGDRFQSAYQALRRHLRKERVGLTRDQSVAELEAGAAGLLISGVALIWMAWKTVRGLVTLGDLALFYQAFQQGLRLMRTLLDNLGQLYANGLFLGNLFEFLALEPKVVDPPAPLKAPGPLRVGIRFREITFRYPGSRRIALDDFSLTIPAGQMAAIVGPNGAGKSTLLKLLCRFYDPEAGGIEIDGIDLRDLAVPELRRLIAVLFQQPVHYNDTVAENISCGNIISPPDLAEIQAAATAAGADDIIRRLPQGYNSLLGKSFAEGMELSVGEWQRIALARAFLRQAPILILDEPTSAMDPWAEADWLDRFRSLSAGRTAILITHRLTTAMRADVIHVMVNGRVVESGSHEDLLARGGLYAQSWTSQMGYQPA
jgi:ATP-binding cassette, subfamily B, bacterial